MRTAMRARRGFTLIEIMIALSVLMVVLGAVVNSIVGANKAQGATVTGSLLKSGGQRAVKNIYLDLAQSRRLIANIAGAGGTDQPGGYYALMDIPSAPAPLTGTTRVFPTINETGAFGVTGTVDGQLDPSTVGNALMFVEPGPPMVLKDAHIFIKEGTSSNHELTDRPYTLNTYKFVLYHLVQVPLPTGAAKINAGTYTLQLMRWESLPYLEKGELTSFINKLDFPTLDLANAAAAPGFMASLSAYPGGPAIAGTWDASATTPSNAFWKYPKLTAVAAGVPTWLPGWAVVSGPKIAMAKQSWAVTTSLSGYALPMMAFNTRGNPNYSVAGLDVPAYASAPTAVYYGFETAIAGPIGARSVLFRLALAARLNAGNTMFGMPMQDVVRVTDM